MSSVENVYTHSDVLPEDDILAGVLNYLNGEELLSKTQALCLSTVDAEGWPKAALLSAGEILALPNGHLRIALFASSDTVANLERDGRLTLSLAHNGGMCSLRLRARKCRQGMPELSLAFFEAEIERVRLHRAPYADVTGGISFALHEPSAVLNRWRRQIEALRAVS
ncbi:MAG: pyridoxamine 5'-phosphate oxidase family protein [Verrucomicrobia bacterium]|nr:pyridoxamine 5'-phosphate oxidase family protein [Verrucomicrobiota bacterium]